MALVLKDRVQETTLTSGTGTLTLTGAVGGFQTFSAAIGNGNTTFYTIYDPTAQVWEVGVGTVGAGTLARTTVLSNSSGTTTPISLAGNSTSVFCTYPAEKSINYDANGVATIGQELGYADTGIVGSFTSTVAGYNQVIVQNKSTATNASSNLNVSNDAGTAGSNYAELGINSSTFTGAGSFNIAGASYVASASTDLTLGTYGAYNVHFVTNSNTTDAMTIFNDGGISLGGFANPGIANMAASKFVPGYTAVTAAAGTTVLTEDSNYYQNLLGTTTQTFQLPDATTLLVGTTFIFDNDSTGALSIVDNASGPIDTIPTGGIDYIYLANNSTVAGTWRKHAFIPASYDFNNTTASFGNAAITNAVWNGTTIGTAYGGTGLTSFSAANYALYSTNASTLTAGTLPTAAGGTGLTTYTQGDLVYASATNTLGKLADVATGNALISGGVGADPSWGKIGLTTHVDGTLPIGNGGTGQTTANAAFNALVPSQTSNSGKYLTTNGTDTSWATVSITPAAVSDQVNTSTGYFDLPSGTTAQRPGSPADGFTRFNTSLNAIETYSSISSKWEIIVYFTVPNAPTIGTATATGSTTATVTYTAPVDTGSGTSTQAITSYTAVSSPGGITGTVSTSGSGTITVTGLTANTAYTFTVFATNAAGNSASSAASNSITTFTVPDAPTIGTATTTGSTTATVSYTAPAFDGGTPITSYTAVSSPGGITGTLSTAGSGTITVTGLTTNTAYTFTVFATNAVGNSANSAASNSITTWAVPDAPTIGTATATGSTTATVSYTAPAFTGGQTITSYTAVSSPGGITGTLSTSGSGTINVTGLTTGTAYTFTVFATNSVGNSANSAASNSITTFSVPGAPTIGTATATGSNTATVSYTAPAFDGGTPITSYTAVSSPGGITGTISTAGSGTITVSGLTGQTSYTFVVYATNAIGNSANSAASNSITTPKAPYTVTFLSVGGGGGGSSGAAANGGGAGGAGGFVTGSFTATGGTVYSVTVGGGGAINGGGNNNGNQGGSSTVTGQTTAVGGGFGSMNGVGGGGGSGGGGNPGPSAGGAGTVGQGNNGGSGWRGPGNPAGGGGGGGAGAAGGGDAANHNGGNGTASSITGSSVTYAGGGGGGSDSGLTSGGGPAGGTGGSGGGGNGGGSRGVAGTVSNGGTNLGGGGGGGAFNINGGTGGSGVVVLSMPTSSYSGTTTGSPSVTTSGGNTILRYTSGSGSYTG